MEKSRYERYLAEKEYIRNLNKAEYTQLLVEQFKQIKEERPDKDYEQGPLLALYLIYGKM